MTCDSCVSSVTKALKEVDGVKVAKVTLAGERAQVTYPYFASFMFHDSEYASQEYRHGSVMQAVAPRTAADKGVRLPYPNGRLQTAATAKRIKELAEPVILMCYHWNGVEYRTINERTWVHRLACLLLEIPARGRTVWLAGRLAKAA